MPEEQKQRSQNNRRADLRSSVHLDIRGRHRRQVELNRLNKEISLLEEELQALKGLPPASSCCKEFLESVGKQPDPLLPFISKGQSVSSWDRWFRGHSNNPVCSCFCSFQAFSCRKLCSCWRLMFGRFCCLFPRKSTFPCCFSCQCMGCVRSSLPCKRK